MFIKKISVVASLIVATISTLSATPKFRFESLLHTNEENGKYTPFFSVDHGNFVYLVNYRDGKIDKYSPSGQYIDSIGKKGYGKGQFLMPISVVLDDEGSIYVLDFLKLEIEKFDSMGNYLSSVSLAKTILNKKPLHCNMPFEFKISKNKEIFISSVFSCDQNVYDGVTIYRLNWDNPQDNSVVYNNKYDSLSFFGLDSQDNIVFVNNAMPSILNKYSKAGDLISSKTIFENKSGFTIETEVDSDDNILTSSMFYNCEQSNGLNRIDKFSKDFDSLGLFSEGHDKYAIPYVLSANNHVYTFAHKKEDFSYDQDLKFTEYDNLGFILNEFFIDDK